MEFYGYSMDISRNYPLTFPRNYMAFPWEVFHGQSIEIAWKSLANQNNQMVIKGFKHSLVLDDLWYLNQKDSCAAVVPHLEKHWKKELERRKRQYGGIEYENWRLAFKRPMSARVA
uniref:Multidrug resistance-associated protein 1 n=1 Tax=Magallana gigas TaxID=29159 RepID=K1P6B8_MAGGI